MLRKKIVIVEDDITTSVMLENIVGARSEWAIVGTARGAFEAIDIIVRADPDLVLLDLILPPYDGFTVMEKVREENVSCKFLLLSSVTNENLKAKAASLGASFCIPKPVNADLLCGKMHELLGTTEDIPSPVNVPKDPALVQWERKVENKLLDFFVRLGIPATQNGFTYLQMSIKYSINDQGLLTNLSGKLYPAVAKKCGVSEYVVERSIRNSIETTWQRGSTEYFNQQFDGYVFANKPTNGEFLRLMTSKLLTNYPRP